MRRLALVAAGLLATACQRSEGWDSAFQRMVEQPRADLYEPSQAFPDGRVMQPPPAGTVPRDRILGRPLLTRGIDQGGYAERIPLPVTRRLLEAGRTRFDVLCAACHGVLGDGVSVVASKMTLRRPPSLIDDRVRAFPPGRLFRVIQAGYGLMPSYAAELSVTQSWAVVAYLRALQLSQHAELATLPPAVRRELAREAR